MKQYDTCKVLWSVPLLWATAFSISLLFNPLVANAQVGGVTGTTPTSTVDPKVRSKTSDLAQGVTYIDANGKEVTAANYTYKRVIKYEGALMDDNHLPVYMNGFPIVTNNFVQTGRHYCSLVEYYRTGETAREVKWLWSFSKNCSPGAIHGQEILYYKNGSRKQVATYDIGKLHRRLTAYDEAGNQTKQEDYDHGVRIEENRLIVGTWKFEWYYSQQRSMGAGIIIPGNVKVISTVTYSQDNSGEASHITGYGITQSKSNWKYIPKDASSGMLETYQGGNLVERGIVKWLSRDQHEYTVNFSPDSTVVGKQFVRTRQ